MLLGIAVSSTNWIYFNKKISFFFEFIPQILFLSSIFGYMSILIITKWLIQWPDSSAPRLLNLMIEMILSPWSLSPKYLIFNYQVDFFIFLFFYFFIFLFFYFFIYLLILFMNLILLFI